MLKVGAAWKKQGKSNSYISISLDRENINWLDPTKKNIHLVMMTNKYKIEGSNAPDYNLFITDSTTDIQPEKHPKQKIKCESAQAKRKKRHSGGDSPPWDD